MKSYRRYAFPPLTRLLSGTHAMPEAEATDSALTEEVLEEYRKAGYEEGHSAGYAEGIEIGRESAAREARTALEALSEPLDALVAGFAQLQNEYQAAAHEQVAGLVEQVAKVVIRAELESRPEQILAFVDEALSTLPKPAEKIEVRLHPGEYQRVLKAAPRRAKRFGLTPDPQLELGECRISAGERELDVGCAQRLATCMEQIHTLLHAGPGKESVNDPFTEST
jgi:flagellar assembly protein FliH